MSFTTQHVLVVVKAGGCGTCKRFSEVYPDLGKVLEASNVKVGNIVEVSIPSYAHPTLDERYPRSLRGYLRFFPMVMLVPKANWDTAVASPASELPLKGRVMNGTVETQSGKEIARQQSPTINFLQKESLIQWIKTAARDIDEQKTQATSFVPPPQMHTTGPTLGPYTPPTTCTVGQFVPHRGRYY